MNIFYLHEDPIQNAKWHIDKHIVKMPIEYAQLMSTAHRMLDGEMYIDRTANNRRIKRWRLNDERESVLYKASHINQPKYQFEGNKDFVCTMYLNFFIRDNKLNMKVQMRSNDIFYGLTFDAPFFSFVYQHVLIELKNTYPELETGTYYHCADNIHYYERHFDLADDILNDAVILDDIFDNTEVIVREPMFKIINGACVITEVGNEYIKSVNELIGKDAKQLDYKKLLHKYVLKNEHRKI